MFALFIGYLVVQLALFTMVKMPDEMNLSAIVFSISVFVIWSFIPAFCYLMAKSFGAKGDLSKLILFAVGLSVAIGEKLLLKLNILNNEQQLVAGARFELTTFGL